jgi:GTPase SAR1 family protein
MTGAEPFLGPAVEIGLWAVPKGFALVRSWWAGKEILVIGQARAGKTTFRDYLQYGLFEDAKDTAETPDIEPTDRFDVGIGRDAALKLIVSTAVDCPGQVGAVEHANLAFERNPHALIIVLDLTTPLLGEPDRASASWLTRFCKRYEAMWRVNRKRRNRIKSIIVVMNKVDRMDQATVENHKQEYRRIVDTELRDARGTMIAEIAVLPCSVVTNPQEKKLVDGVIAHLAKGLAKS